MTAAHASFGEHVRIYERPSIPRLTLVELRKMVDTRAGFWLLLSSAALTAAVVALFCAFAKAADFDIAGVLEVAIGPASILLPILGVLLVTSEWSQRTALLTFTLVPQRGRVFAAKLLAGVLLALAALAICLPAATVGNALSAPETADKWTMPPELLGQTTLAIVIGMLTGLGFGAMLLSSAPAIVLYFALPFAWAALGAIPALQGTTQWLDPVRTQAPLTADTMSGIEWARLGTALALWLGVPLVVGLWRITRGEIH